MVPAVWQKPWQRRHTGYVAGRTLGERHVHMPVPGIVFEGYNPALRHLRPPEWHPARATIPFHHTSTCCTNNGINPCLPKSSRQLDYGEQRIWDIKQEIMSTWPTGLWAHRFCFGVNVEVDNGAKRRVGNSVCEIRGSYGTQLLARLGLGHPQFGEAAT